MDTDLFLVIGLLLGALAITSAVAAYADGRAPRVAMAFIAIAGALIVTALLQKPGGYTLGAVPIAFYSVIARILN